MSLTLRTGGLELPDAPGGPSLVRGFVFTILKWKRMMCAVTVTLTLAAAVYVAMQPPTRTASARLILGGNPSLPTSGATVLPPEIRRAETWRLTSREILRPVVDILLNGTAPQTHDLVETVLADLQARTTAHAIAETNIIQLTHYATSPDDPVRILSLIIDSYRSAHATTTPSHAVVSYATDEQAKVVGALQAAEDRLDRWRKANRLVSVEAAITSQLEALGRGEAALREVEAERVTLEAKSTALKRQLREHPTHVVVQREHVTNPLITTLQAELATAEAAFTTDVNTTLVTKLKGDLVAAELALAELQQRYTDKERRVQEKVEHVALLKRELATAEHDAAVQIRTKIVRLKEDLARAESQAEILGRQTTGLNPVRDQLERDVAAAETVLAGLASRQSALAAQVRNARDIVADLTAKKLEEDRLSNAVALAKESLQVHAKKLDEARLTAGAQHEFTRLSVIEPPYEPPRSLLAPFKLVLLSFMLAVMMSCGVAFAYEFSRHAVQRREDVEYYLAVPMLAAIPERTPSNDAHASPGSSLTSRLRKA